MKIANTVFLAALLAVSLACGYSAPATTAPTPGGKVTITELSPNCTAPVPSTNPPLALTVNGTGFIGTSVIYWNSMAETTMVVAAGTQLMTMIPATDVDSAGTATVEVTNPGTPGNQYGGGTTASTSNSMTFTIGSCN
jgi:hypothetical protein